MEIDEKKRRILAQEQGKQLLLRLYSLRRNLQNESNTAPTRQLATSMSCYEKKKMSIECQIVLKGMARQPFLRKYSLQGSVSPTKLKMIENSDIERSVVAFAHSTKNSVRMSFQDASRDFDLEEPEQSIIGGFWMEGDSLAPPCQTGMEVVEGILDFAEISASRTVYDLGCGDGRICILASKIYGCKSCGSEIDPRCVKKFRENLEKEGDSVGALVQVADTDLRDIKIEDNAIIVCYLLQQSIEEITPLLRDAIIRGATLVCNTWGPHTFQPAASRKVGGSDSAVATLFKYDKSSVK